MEEILDSFIPVWSTDITGGSDSSSTANSSSTELDNPLVDVVIDNFSQSNECAFSKDHTASVCSTRPLIQKMAELVKKTGQKININDPIKVVDEAKKTLGCGSESCVIQHPEFVKFANLDNVDELLDALFKPVGPALNNGLLSNYNIDKVLEQFEIKYKGFLHIPFHMQGFTNSDTRLMTADLAEHLKEPGRSFGVVMNTDTYNGPGIHWYCLFGENKDGVISLEYFNSSGLNALTETEIWLKKKQFELHKKLKMPIVMKYSNGIQFQHDNHSCGVYCLMYIWLRLENVEQKHFKANIFNDKLMKKARAILFRPDEE